MGIKSISQIYELNNNNLIPKSQRIDLTHILFYTISLNGLHDEIIQKEMGIKLLKDNQTWVIIQYQIYQFDEIKLSQEIKIDTRIININPFFVTRRNVVYQNGEICLEIFTQFAAIDLNKRRISRLMTKHDFSKLVDDSYGIEFEKLKFSNVNNPIQVNTISIKESDIDINRHVNNLVYLRWAYLNLPIEFIQNHLIDKIQVKYEKEILWNDDIEIRTFIDVDQLISQQILYNNSKDQIASFIEIYWK